MTKVILIRVKDIDNIKKHMHDNLDKLDLSVRLYNQIERSMNGNIRGARCIEEFMIKFDNFNYHVLTVRLCNDGNYTDLNTLEF
jgi:DNA-directed RNA polymerase alpha subunit